jgi:hypothetical protein
MTTPAPQNEVVDHTASQLAVVGGWRDRSSRIAFWTFTAIGVPATFAGWLMLVIASYEEVSEQGKAVAAGTTMAGTTFVLGVIPLVIVHFIGFVILCALGALGRLHRGKGALLGAAAVVGASLISLAVVLIIGGGHLLASAEYVP